MQLRATTVLTKKLWISPLLPLSLRLNWDLLPTRSFQPFGRETGHQGNNGEMCLNVRQLSLQAVLWYNDLTVCSTGSGRTATWTDRQRWSEPTDPGLIPAPQARNGQLSNCLGKGKRYYTRFWIPSVKYSPSLLEIVYTFTICFFHF